MTWMPTDGPLELGQTVGWIEAFKATTDVFAVGDIHELLTRNMQGKAILCRDRQGHKQYASSVMLLDCAKLKHWDFDKDLDDLFAGFFGNDWPAMGLSEGIRTVWPRAEMSLKDGEHILQLEVPGVDHRGHCALGCAVDPHAAHAHVRA